MKTLNKILIASAIIAILPRAVSASAEDQPLVFPHTTHVEDEGLECDGCHQPDRKEGGLGLDTEFCAECHEEGFGFKPERKSRKLGLTFPHSMHADAFSCARCHQKVFDGEAEKGAPLLDGTDCFLCHKENEVEINTARCKVCHDVDPRKHKPSTHGSLWIKGHGENSKWNVFSGDHSAACKDCAPNHGGDCRLCHSQGECRSCHKRTAPESHSVIWRARTHGKRAEIDRDSCKNCHETGTCIRCHRDSKPRSHRGSFKSTHGTLVGGAWSTMGEKSCRVCHAPSFCAACHTR